MKCTTKTSRIRGFAIYLNSLIKLHDDTKSVDNIILDLFKIAKQQPFSVKSFKER